MKNDQSVDQPSYDEFLGYLRSALHYLYDPVHLRRSPLVRLFGLAGEFDQSAALQRRLTEKIHTLKPAIEEPPQSLAWRIYDALNLQYIRQFTRNTVASQLGISERQLRREQRLALEALAQHLWEDIDFISIQGPEISAEMPPEEGQEKDQALSEELGWLKNSSMEQRIPLGDILSTVAGLVQPLAEKTRVSLQIQFEPGLAEIQVAQQAIRHILLTILSEVIPHAQQGQVAIFILRQKTNIEIRITSHSVMPSLPAPVKGENGIATARRLASFYGANLLIEQQGQDQIVILSFRMPEHIPVLIIDDNADWLSMLERFAVGSNYHIISTREPDTACALAKKAQPAVIFLDVMMPAMDGWQILSDLRHEPATSQIPIVVCTVLPLEGLALSLGGNAFLQKPVTQDQFLNTVEKMINLQDWSSHPVSGLANKG